MRINTHDIPAVKFCIAFDVSERGVRLIPFEDVDGLLVEEVLDVIGTNNFAIVALADTKSINGEHRYTKCLITEMFADDLLQSQKRKRIDEVIENRFTEKYRDIYLQRDSYQQRRIYECFFERYQYDYEETCDKLTSIIRLSMRK